ncbi:unnamed protein product [Ambrosiozyma monospora]|uniref:lipoyl(octanoyl) transferase n=1 Tax=Ambrosiozyma monospora TaxID=43982 RepID=A0A9W6YSI0_AMBMO|nr:unnamed protein product [Ambrosiozyma monospora]
MLKLLTKQQSTKRLFSTSISVSNLPPSCTTKFHPTKPQATSLQHIHIKGQQPYSLGSKLQEHIAQQCLTYKNHQILKRNPHLSHKLSQLPEPTPLKPLIFSFEFQSVYTGGKREKIQTTLEDISKIEHLKHCHYIQTDRGGQVTYHGPGQLVVYPILDLTMFSKLTSRCYVSQLEKSIIEVLNNNSSFGLNCQTTENTGVWCHHLHQENELRKISSIGVNVRKGITSHGVSINCNTDLKFVNDPQVVMCGLDGYKQTSIKEQLGHDVSLNFVADEFVKQLSGRLGIDQKDITSVELDPEEFEDEKSLLEKLDSLVHYKQ